jgi:hypothetical protein
MTEIHSEITKTFDWGHYFFEHVPERTSRVEQMALQEMKV